MTKYKPERDLPDFAREFKTLSPTALVKHVLDRRNEEITPQAVTMWFKRHPEIEEQIRKELVEGLPTQAQAVDQSVFQNGSFQETQSVRNWVREMNARELDPKTIDAQVRTLRLICQGKFSGLGLDFVASGKWCLKHPDRLNMTDALEIITLLRESNADTYQYKKCLKDFLTSKDIVVGKKFTVGRPKGFGKFAKLKASEDQIRNVIQDVETKNKAAAVADEFMLKTGTRVSATLKAKIEDLIQVRDHAVITVYDKGRRSKYSQGKPWDKKIDSELLTHLFEIAQGRKSGLIFEGLSKFTLSELNKDAITKHCSDILEKYPSFPPNHFFRHCFAQIMLVRTDWNYAIVGALGGWTPKALEESYGQPPDDVVNEWAKTYTLDIKIGRALTASFSP
jgi:integrase